MMSGQRAAIFGAVVELQDTSRPELRVEARTPGGGSRATVASTSRPETETDTEP
jgi:hypothetical protein